MQKQLAFLAVLSATIVGCASNAATESAQPRLDQTSAGAKIEILAEGGIAALSINHVVRHDDRYFLYTQRHLCNGACAALDSASGLLPATTNDSLFNAILPLAGSLKTDYGTTRGGADMMSYTVRVTTSSATKTITADDGTMPEPLRQIVTAVRLTVDAARR